MAGGTEGGVNTGGSTPPGRPSNTPDVYIVPLGGNVFVNQPQQGLSTMGYVNPVQFEYTEVGNPETNQGSYNYVTWTVDSNMGHGELYKEERLAQQDSSGAIFSLPGGVKALNLDTIEDYFFSLGEFGGTFDAKITCTPSLLTEDSDGNATSIDGTTAVFLLRLMYGQGGDKSTADEDGNIIDVDPNPPLESLIALPPGTPNYAPFKATILGSGVNDNGFSYLSIDESWNEFKEQLSKATRSNIGYHPAMTFINYTLSYKSNDKEDLNTYLHFGEDKLYLTTNVVTDAFKYPRTPHSAVFKMYEPLPSDIEEKDKVYMVKEILPMLTETVELVSYDPEDDDNDVKDVVVLRTADTLP